MISHYNKKRGQMKENHFVLEDVKSERVSNEPNLNSDGFHEIELSNENISDDLDLISDGSQPNLISEEMPSFHLQIEPVFTRDFQCQNFINCRYRSKCESRLKRHQNTCKKTRTVGEFQCKGCYKRGDYREMRTHLYDWQKSVSNNKKSHIHDETPVHIIKKYLEDLKDMKKFSFTKK